MIDCQALLTPSLDEMVQVPKNMQRSKMDIAFIKLVAADNIQKRHCSQNRAELRPSSYLCA